MATPYLQRRGGRWSFRISVPVELRHLVGAREICRALGTGERRDAVPLALEFGAAATTLFNLLRAPVTDKPNSNMLMVLRHAQDTLQLKRMLQQSEDQLVDVALDRIRAVRVAEESHSAVLMDLNREHAHAQKLQAATVQAAAAERDAFKAALKALQAHPAPPAQGTPAQAVESAPVPAGALLGAYLDEYLAAYDKVKNAEMFKKIVPALELMRELLGSKPVRHLVQRDMEDLFDVVRRLPQKWQATCRREKKTARELAKAAHSNLLSAKTFQDNYIVPIRLFLAWARDSRHDEGFPVNLNVRSIKLGREDNTGINKQRALRLDELERLFHGPELQGFKTDPLQMHKWWLPVLGFYTGARVNELCQINPQTDIVRDDVTGIDYALITEDTESDERVRKSVKTGKTRAVPIHSELIAGGFLDYVRVVRNAGSKLLFPSWKPASRGKASTQGEKWFRDLLAKTGLRDETPYKSVRGSHVFRHTLLAAGLNSSPSIDAGPITGHAAVGKSSVQSGYEGELWLKRKLELLEAIQFGFKP